MTSKYRHSVPVLDGGIDAWIARGRPFTFVLLNVPNWTDLAMRVGLARIDELLHSVRSTFHDAFPPGAISENVSRGVFAYLVPASAEVTVEIARVARAATLAGDPAPVINIGAAGARGDGNDHAAQLVFQASLALLQHAPHRSDHVAVALLQSPLPSDPPAAWTGGTDAPGANSRQAPSNTARR